MRTNEAFARLKAARGEITKQQYRTLKGQMLSGNIDGAMKGLQKILERVLPNEP